MSRGWSGAHEFEYVDCAIPPLRYFLGGRGLRAMSTLKGRSHVFESVEQRMDHLDPRDVGMLGDRVLIEYLPGDERIGSIWLPDVCRDKEKLRWGNVIAVGPGDKYIETVADQRRMDGDGRVPLRRKHAERECRTCNGTGEIKVLAGIIPCPQCDGSGNLRLPMACKSGHRVLYSRRLEAEVTIQGQTYGMVHEEQSVFGIWTTFDIVNYCECEPYLRLLRDRVLVSRDAVHQKVGSLFIPSNCAEERPEGIVRAVGPGKLLIDGTYAVMEVKAGDHIAFDPNAGSDLTIKGERFLMLREKDVYGVLG